MFADSRTPSTEDEVGVIDFIDFETFKTLDGFPRCPNHRLKNPNLLTSSKSINRDGSLLIFISHCWLRGHKGSEGWDGQAHADNVNGDKFHLCVKGIEWVKLNFASRMKNCYVWMDFCCIDQDNRADLPRALKRYDKIIECCDAIFTPIVDLDPDWKLPNAGVKFFEMYQAKLWNNGPDAYLNRAWCRVEMLYAANIPAMPNSDGVERHTLFDAGLAIHCRMNRRPHLLYGHREVKHVLGPHVLDPLQNVYFQEYSPLKGELSEPSDIRHIENLLDMLRPYIDANTAVESYEGETNEEGTPHGVGTMKYLNGDVFEGQWINGVIEGRGTCRYYLGAVYEGEWKNGAKEGHGVFRYASGGVYEGEWKNNQKHGKGKHTFVYGASYEGEFVDGEKCGHGVYYYANGDVYTGEFKNNSPDGRGRLQFSSGSYYEGDWKDGKQEGFGVWQDPVGTVYTGEFKNGNKEGQGRAIFKSGVVYQGEWKNDTTNGEGLLFQGGEMYKVESENGKMKVLGRCVIANSAKSDSES